MSDKAELAEAVVEAAARLNWAMSTAADAGILVGIEIDENPERTAGATPYPKITIQVLSGLE